MPAVRRAATPVPVMEACDGSLYARGIKVARRCEEFLPVGGQISVALNRYAEISISSFVCAVKPMLHQLHAIAGSLMRGA